MTVSIKFESVYEETWVLSMLDDGHCLSEDWNGMTDLLYSDLDLERAGMKVVEAENEDEACALLDHETIVCLGRRVLVPCPDNDYRELVRREWNPR